MFYIEISYCLTDFIIALQLAIGVIFVQRAVREYKKYINGTHYTHFIF